MSKRSHNADTSAQSVSSTSYPVWNRTSHSGEMHATLRAPRVPDPFSADAANTSSRSGGP